MTYTTPETNYILNIINSTVKKCILNMNVVPAERADKKVDPGSEVRMEINVILRTNSPPVPVNNLSTVSPPATIQSECNPQGTQILGSENEVVECDGE